MISKRVLSLAVACVMCLTVMSTSVSVAASSGELQTKKAAPAFEESAKGLLKLIEANQLEHINMDSYGDFRMKEYIRNMNSKELYIKEAQNFKAKTGGDDTRYLIYDINKDGNSEMIITYPAGVRTGVNVYRYDQSNGRVIKVRSLFGVNEVRKDPKNKQIMVMASDGAKSYSYTSYKFNGTKLKQSVSWSRDNKKYKKNKKKITKKVFTKKEKAYKKLKKLSFKNIPTTEYDDVKLSEYTYWSKDLYYNDSYYGSTVDTSIMQKGNTESQDKYLAYDFSYEVKSNGDYSDNPTIIRYVFGPDVVNPKTGKTYQQQDWEQKRMMEFGRAFACLWIASAQGEYGESDTAPLYEDEIKNLSVSDVTLTNGEKSYKGKEYSADIPYYKVKYSFFSEGAYAGRIAEVSLYDEDGKNKIPAIKYTYDYGTEGIENEPEWDPLISGSVIGKGPESVKNRTLSIQTNIDGKQGEYSIVTAENVKYELYTGDYGEFISYIDDGTEKGEAIIIPPVSTDRTTAKLVESWLNPAADKSGTTFKDPYFPRGVFWAPINSVDLIEFFGQDIEKAKVAFPYMNCYDGSLVDDLIYLEYHDVGEYDDLSMTLLGPNFTVDPKTMAVDTIEYSGYRHTVVGIKCGMTVKKATDMLKASGWVFKNVKFSDNKEIPTLYYEKDGVTIGVLSNAETDKSLKTEEDNTKKGRVYGISVSK